MAAGDWTWYGVGPNVDLSSGSYKVLLTTVTHTPNQDTHTVRTDITNEVTGTLYTAGGVAVTATRTYDGASNEIRVAVSNAVWGAGRDDHVPQRASLQGDRVGRDGSADRLHRLCR
jgi:hypothetical protein